MSKIFLIGMPGSGKSTIGKLLSDALQMPFLDLDHKIEQVAKKTIPEIFQNDGEEVFRKLESQSLQTVIDQHDSFVLATGGGAPCFHDNLKRMTTSGTTIYLKTDTSTLVKRVLQESNRPLLRDSDPETRLNQLFSARKEFYESAKITVENNQNPKQVVGEILGLLKSITPG